MATKEYDDLELARITRDARRRGYHIVLRKDGDLYRAYVEAHYLHPKRVCAYTDPHTTLSGNPEKAVERAIRLHNKYCPTPFSLVVIK